MVNGLSSLRRTTLPSEKKIKILSLRAWFHTSRIIEHWRDRGALETCHRCSWTAWPRSGERNREREKETLRLPPIYDSDGIARSCIVLLFWTRCHSQWFHPLSVALPSPIHSAVTAVLPTAYCDGSMHWKGGSARHSSAVFIGCKTHVIGKPDKGMS